MTLPKANYSSIGEHESAMDLTLREVKNGRRERYTCMVPSSYSPGFESRRPDRRGAHLTGTDMGLHMARGLASRRDLQEAPLGG